MDKKYWNTYYKERKEPAKPTPFAVYLGENYLNNQAKRKTIIELGCGEGRDAVYFEKLGLKVIGVDQSKNSVANLNSNYSNENIVFIEDNFTEFETKFDEKFDFVYSRFSLHAVKEDNEDKVLTWVFNNLKEGGIFFLEVRSTKDELYGKGIKVGENTFKYNEHKRRFVDFEVIKNKTKNYSKILESKLENGLAIYKDADPIDSYSGYLWILTIYWEVA